MGPESPQISVLLPIYNAAPTLGETLDSLLAQDAAGIEIIAVNDGSKDGSESLLKEAAKRDHRLRHVRHEHQGLIPTLNLAISNARAPLMARMDADDLAHPNRLSLQKNFLDNNADIDVVGSLIKCFPDSIVGEGFRVYEEWINSLVTHDEIVRDIFIESPLVHPSVMFRRSAIEAVGGYRDVGWPEDYDLWLRMHHRGMRFGKVKETLLSWREGDARLTRTDHRYSVENFLRTKAHFLAKGPLAASRHKAIVWGSGQIGRRLSKHLQREGVELLAFVDIDPVKIGRERRGAPIIGPETLPDTWLRAGKPLILAAVPSRGARQQIRSNLNAIGLIEGSHYLCVA